ncbi:MAG: hypothetical protein AAF728_05320 [Cyanobacteria bacterium P01_D01_bin.128]
MIIYTHIFNLFAKFLLVTAAVSVVVVLITLDVPVSGGFLFTVSSLVAMALLWPVYYFLLRHLANWLYCALILRTILRWSDLKEVACLFNFDCEGEWIPMTEIRDYRPTSRRERLLDAAKCDDREFGVNRYIS